MKDKYYLSPNAAKEIRMAVKNTLERGECIPKSTYGGILWKGDRFGVALRSYTISDDHWLEIRLGTCVVDCNNDISSFEQITALGTIFFEGDKKIYIKDIDFIEIVLQYAMKLVKEKEEAFENES